MSFTEDLITGFAVLLADASIGLTYTPSGVYTADQTGIFSMDVPQSPARVVTLSPHPLSASSTLSQSMVELQVRSRSAAEDPRDVWALDDAVADVLLGNYPLALSTGIYVSSLDLLGGGSLGRDQNDRWMWSSNYLLSVGRPGPHRK